MLGVVQGGVAAGVDPVDDGPHGGLDVGAGVAQQHEHRLLVVAAAGLAVHHDLVVVARLDQTSIVFICSYISYEGDNHLEHHVEDRLPELVLDQEVGVVEPLEHLHHEMVAAGRRQEHRRGRAWKYFYLKYFLVLLILLHLRHSRPPCSWQPQSWGRRRG